MANLLSYLKSSTNMPHLSPAIEPKLYYLVFVVNPENRLLSSPGLLCACVRSEVHCENPRYTREQILRYVFRHSRTLPTAGVATRPKRNKHFNVLNLYLLARAYISLSPRVYAYESN